jgi:hypothetical protein
VGGGGEGRLYYKGNARVCAVWELLGLTLLLLLRGKRRQVLTRQFSLHAGCACLCCPFFFPHLFSHWCPTRGSSTRRIDAIVSLWRYKTSDDRIPSRNKRKEKKRKEKKIKNKISTLLLFWILFHIIMRSISRDSSMLITLTRPSIVSLLATDAETVRFPFLRRTMLHTQ